MNKLNVVLVEDDAELAEDTIYALERLDFAMAHAASGRELDTVLARGACDVVVLDLGLPGEDGLSIARRLSGRPDMRIVVLTARAGLQNRIDGVTAGADAYLTKPFDVIELAAVIRQLASRLPVANHSFTLDAFRKRLLMPKGHEVLLTSLECQLLAGLARSPERTQNRQEIETLLWGNSTLSTSKRLDILVYRLRQKISRLVPDGGDIISTRWSQGYSLAEPIIVK